MPPLRIVLAFLLATSVPLTTGCAKHRIAAEKTVASVLISDEQEEQIGKQVKQELEQKEKIKYVTDPVVTGYIQKITTKITQQANRDRAGVKWKVHVIDDDKMVNAFATPGGYLYVYSGLILAAENEAELAGVMAHEAGHVVGRHSARQMVNAYGLEAVLSLALGKNPGLLGQIGGAIVGNGAMLAHGRSEEIEADEYGARYTAKAGWDPKGLISFFQKLKAQQGGDQPQILTFLSTHPATGDRISHLNAFIQQNGLKGGTTTVGDLGQVKATLKQ